MTHYLNTGQRACYDAAGFTVACRGSGQDAEYRRGEPWPAPRFEAGDDTVHDRLTGLVWSRNANPAEFPLTWSEALAFIADMNDAGKSGCSDWRLPNRRELRSLVSHQTRRPALPEAHPFRDVFNGWYWSSTTAAISPAHAWYVHMDGARMFFGGKDQSFLVWPVRGAGNGVLPRTGQTLCFDGDGRPVSCAGSGQDGEWLLGAALPEPRFAPCGDGSWDRLTGLVWRRRADLAAGAVTWPEALAAVAGLNRHASRLWRLPTINELDSLVDCANHTPALPCGHDFRAVGDVYWSSTTSAFEPDWAWALYLDKGAVGVGQKRSARFRVWAVSGPHT